MKMILLRGGLSQGATAPFMAPPSVATAPSAPSVATPAPEPAWATPTYEPAVGVPDAPAPGVAPSVVTTSATLAPPNVFLPSGVATVAPGSQAAPGSAVAAAAASAARPKKSRAIWWILGAGALVGGIYWWRNR